MEKNNREGILNPESDIEQLQPGKYDMTPDLATELHLSKHTLRVRPDGTGIFILSPGRTPTSLSIDHPQKVQQTWRLIDKLSSYQTMRTRSLLQPITTNDFNKERI